MRFLSVLIVGLCLATTQVQAESAATLTLTGQGEVAAAPDMATITLGVQAQAKAAADALRETSDKTAKILETLTAAGIAGRDMQTSELALDPLWDNTRYENGTAPKVVGFTARNTVTVRVRDLDLLGGVLDDVVTAGANTFRGLSFGLQDPQPVQDDARRAAVADAMRKAALYAEAAGVKLGPVLSISEAGFSAPRPEMMMEMSRSSGVPVAQGEVGLSASVTMVFSVTP